MTWCPHCAKDRGTAHDYTTSSLCCVDCGKVIVQDVYSKEATFVKDIAEGAGLAGNLIRIESACSESHRRTLEKGNIVINALTDKLGISNVSHATRYYEIAVEHNFTKGRRTVQVAAACLYVACREKEKPFLLIDFSSKLNVNIYQLGAVYLQLCKLLRLQEHPFIHKPIDPSLFMHRYASGLIKDDGNREVSNTALHVATSMEREWIQTGSKPSGTFAAALYVSSMLHGYGFSRADVVKSIHICEAALSKRLIKFENKEAGSLLIQEFTRMEEEFEEEMGCCKQSDKDLKMPGSMEVVCQHRNSTVQPGFGLCKKCYLEFCGGFDDSEPPASQHQIMNNKELELQLDHGAKANVGGNRKSLRKFRFAFPTSGKANTSGDASQTYESSHDVHTTTDETETLSDIDDMEVSHYLNTKEETCFKKIIWERLNKEYFQEQAAKKATAAARKLRAETSEGTHKAQTLAIESKRQKDKRKQASEAEHAAEPPGTKKSKSSKINYDALNSLFGDESTL